MPAEKLNLNDPEVMNRAKTDVGLQEKLLAQNEGLIWHILKSWLKDGKIEADDVYQLGCIGFIKALKSFNPEKAKFTTYVSMIMQNEVRMEYKKTQKHRNNAHLEDIVTIGKENDEATLGDMLASPKNTESEAIANINVSQLADALSEKDRQIVAMRLAGQNQEAISETMGYTQSYVSRRIKGIGQIIREGVKPKRTPNKAIPTQKEEVNLLRVKLPSPPKAELEQLIAECQGTVSNMAKKKNVSWHTMNLWLAENELLDLCRKIKQDALVVVKQRLRKIEEDEPEIDKTVVAIQSEPIKPEQKPEPRPGLKKPNGICLTVEKELTITEISAYFEALAVIIASSPESKYKVSLELKEVV